MAHDDLDRLREGYAAFNRGDLEGVLDSVAPGFVLTDRDEVPDAGTYRGLDEALQAFAGVRAEFDEYEIEPVEMVDGGDWVVVTARQVGVGKASGVRVEGEVFHLWRLRDGKAVGLHAFSTRDEAFAAAEDPGWPSS